MNESLLPELRAILEACGRENVPVLVIGAFSVYAYDSLIRTSKDIDLVVASSHWLTLKEILESLDYAVTPRDTWATAIKGSATVSPLEVHIALDGVTDFDTGTIYPIGDKRPEMRPARGLDFALPVLPLEEVLITKWLALRDKDVVDIVQMCLRHTDEIHPVRLWSQAETAGLTSVLRDQIRRFEDMLHDGEVLSIWYDQVGDILPDTHRDAALKVVRRLLKHRA